MKPATALRLQRRLSIESRLLALAALASVALGAIVTSSPAVVVALLAISAALAIALTRPALLFSVGIALLAIESTKIFGAESLIGRPGTYKLVLYACALPLLLDRGIVRRKCAPLAAYVVLAMLTESVATPLPGLTTGQTVSSLATLCLAWVVFAIKWDWRRDNHLLKLLAFVPVLSVFIGAVLQAAGVIELFREVPPRLEGATIAASLGAISVAAVIACVVLRGRQKWRWAVWLGLADVVILGATLSRGAVLALVIASAPTLIRFWRRQLASRGPTVIAKVTIAVTSMIVGAFILGSGLVARSESATDYVAGRGRPTHEVASGRLEAWTVAYHQATVNVAFGRGLGAGPLVGKTPGSPLGFTAQHNEYLRMFLEGGLLGSVILLTAIVTTCAAVIRRAPPQVRSDLAMTGVAFAVYSFTENTLTAPAVAIAFLLLFSLASSRASLSPHFSDAVQQDV
jgi:teichuronic acid biosynthesis protein TuaE